MIRVDRSRRTTITLLVKEDGNDPVIVKQITADTNNQGVSNISNFVVNQDQ
ncbi:hypothetical protein OZX68_03730 [Streptococcaceae bacterium ESL0729]|nr:hypothetical protein OZX68_03730 [Streptococcaceae bacterium ESL0729]